MTTDTISADALAKLNAAVAAQAIERQPFLRLSLWPNQRMRADKQDAQFNGQVRLSTVKLGELLANAMHKGEPEVALWIDVWTNEPGVSSSGGAKPIMTGQARNVVEERATATG